MTEMNESVVVFRVFLFLLVGGLEENGASGKVEGRRGDGLRLAGVLVTVAWIIVLKLIETTEVVVVLVAYMFAPILVDSSYPTATEISNITPCI